MDIKKTVTSVFILPSMSIPRDKLTDNGFVNAYIGDLDEDHQYEDCIYVLFKPTDFYKFGEFILDERDRTDDLIEDYDHDGGFVVLVYRLDSKFMSDYALVKQGKYSKTSQVYQAKFPKVVKIMKNGLHKDEISIQYRVFNRTEDLVKFWEDKLGVNFSESQEVWQGFDYEKETINIQKIKEYVE